MESDFSVETLPSLPLQERHLLPESSGVYFALGQKNEIFYIGQAKDMRARWLGVLHHNLTILEAIPGAKIAWFSVPDFNGLLPLESYLIALFNPPLNRNREKIGVPIRKSMGGKILVVERHIPLVDKICEQCKKSFKGQHRAKYCSKACSNKAAYWRNPDAYRTSRMKTYNEKRKKLVGK